MVELVKKVHSMRSELYQVKSDTDNSDDITKAAELLGNGIKKMKEPRKDDPLM